MQKVPYGVHITSHLEIMLIWQYEQDGFQMYLVRHRTELSVKTMLHFWIATLGWILHWNFSFLLERLTKPVQNFMPQQINTNTIESNNKKNNNPALLWKNLIISQVTGNNRKKKYIYAYIPCSLLQHLGRGDTVLWGLGCCNTPSTFTSCSMLHLYLKAYQCYYFDGANDLFFSLNEGYICS